MILVNPTLYPALLFRTVLDADRMLASVVVRVTYSLAARLTVADDQLWKVSPEPWESPAGLMEEDGPFLRGGVDLFVFGRVYPPSGTRSMRVHVRAGGFLREAVASGRRTWIRDGRGGLVSSEPEPFSSFPLTLDHAFGGTTEADGLQVPFPDNALGKGFHATAEQALGRELPNLEEPNHMMNHWNDMPPACGFGFCPRVNGARMLNGTVRDAQEQNILDFRPHLFNQAFVPMIAPALAPGDPVELVGFSPQGPVRFMIPAAPAYVRLGFGERVVERALAVDQIGVEVEAARVFVTWRFPFRYVVREREERMCELVERVSS
jgi:hypothetical protein